MFLVAGSFWMCDVVWWLFAQYCKVERRRHKIHYKYAYYDLLNKQKQVFFTSPKCSTLWNDANDCEFWHKINGFIYRREIQSVLVVWLQNFYLFDHSKLKTTEIYRFNLASIVRRLLLITKYWENCMSDLCISCILLLPRTSKCINTHVAKTKDVFLRSKLTQSPNDCKRIWTWNWMRLTHSWA